MKVVVDADWKAISVIHKKLDENGISVKHAIKKNSSTIALEIDEPVDEALVKQLVNEAVSEYNLPNIDKWDPTGIRNLDKKGLSDDIDSKVTDFDSMKIYLKELSALVQYLLKRITDET